MSQPRTAVGPPRIRTILVVGPHVPGPDLSAGDKRLHILCRLLASRHRVHFYPLNHDIHNESNERYRRLMEAAGVRVWIHPTRQLRTVLATQRLDLVIAEFWSTEEEVGDLLRSRQPWASLLVDSVDIHFARSASAAEVGAYMPEHENAREREIAAYRRSDGVIVISDEDRAALGQAGEFKTTRMIPIIQEIFPRADRVLDPEVLFIGGFDHPPNVDGIVWFAEKSWPLVRESVPNARLTIIGSRPRPEVLALHGREGIEVVGYVPETAPYLERTAVSVAPLRYGAGMKGKVVEALAHGLPVASTRFGVQGLGGRDGETYVVADDPEELARGVVGLLSDPDRARRIGLAGQRLVAGICSPDAVRDALFEMVETAVEQAGNRAPAPLSWHLGKAVEHLYELVMSIGPIKSMWVRARHRSPRPTPAPEGPAPHA